MNTNETVIHKLPQRIPRKFSEIILKKFEERKRRNPQYSLRSFARDLEISPGNLSDILKNKLNISYAKAEIIAEHLRLLEDERDLFLSLIENESSGKHYKFETDYTLLSNDVYAVFSNWYYFAIVELVRVKDFVNDVDWIAHRLGITSDNVSIALESLKKVGLIQELDGKLLQTYDFFAPPNGTPSEAARSLNKQLLSKAALALDHQPIEEREISSGFLRVRTKDMSLVQKRIKDFKRDLMAELEMGEDHDSIYAFSIQFFRADDGREV